MNLISKSSQELGRNNPVIFETCDFDRWEFAMTAVANEYNAAGNTYQARYCESLVVYYSTIFCKWIIDGMVDVFDGMAVCKASPKTINLRAYYFLLKRCNFPIEARSLLADLYDWCDKGMIPNKLATGLLSCITASNIDVIVHMIYTLWKEEYFHVYEEGNDSPLDVVALSDIEKRKFYRNGIILSRQEQINYVKLQWFGSDYLRAPEEVVQLAGKTYRPALERATSLYDVVVFSTRIASMLKADIPFIYLAYKQMLAA